MKNLIVTANDAKYGEFLVNHWIKSLKSEVDLTNIDIMVLDYGLSQNQKEELHAENVILKTCKKDGHVTSIRFRDMACILPEYSYDQVLSIDSGDVIFQGDFSHVFDQDKDLFRGVYEGWNFSVLPFDSRTFFSEDISKKIRHELRDKKVINAGVIFGPFGKFLELCNQCNNYIKNKQHYGPDQMAVNLVVHSMGFKEINRKYNLIPGSSKEKYILDGNLFLMANGEKAVIIHNAGGYGITRVIKNFGYNQDMSIRKIKKGVMKTIMNTLGTLGDRLKKMQTVDNGKSKQANEENIIKNQ
jgi:hypothetical protein